MKTIITLAWRNIWRNKFRSSVIIAALTLGLLAGVSSVAFMNGMIEQRIQSVIHTELAHIQMHRQGFRDNGDFALRIQNTDQIFSYIMNRYPDVRGISKRLVINAMIASAETGSGVRVYGVEPLEETKVSDVAQKLTDGSFFGSTKKNQIVIGEKLALKLKVKVGNKLIITMQDGDKNIVSAAFKVVGIFATDNAVFDENTVYAQFDDIGHLEGIPNDEAHEIAILMAGRQNVTAVADSLALAFPQLEILDWQHLSPEAGYLVDATKQYMYIFLIIILLALGFGIINTMLMAVMERFKELGMLMSIGMKRMKVFAMIMVETLFLSLLGGFFGIIAGVALVGYFGQVGVNMSVWKEAFAELGYASIIYPYVTLDIYLEIGIMVMAIGVISAIYPAWKAIHLNPVEATHNE